MSWQNKEINWEKTEHPWDGFGDPGKSAHVDQDLDAKVLAIWRRQELGEIVEKIMDAASAAAEYTDDPELASGFALAIAAVNLFPLHLKVIKEDEHATAFLKLLHDDNEGNQYFLKSELKITRELDWLVSYFLQCGVLTEQSDRFIVNGRVLNRAHIRSD